MIFCRAMELRNKERAKILSAKIQSNLSKRMSNYFASQCFNVGRRIP